MMSSDSLSDDPLRQTNIAYHIKRWQKQYHLKDIDAVTAKITG